MGVEYSEVNDGFSGVSFKPIGPGMAEFWASTGGRMADMLLGEALVPPWLTSRYTHTHTQHLTSLFDKLS